MNRYPSLIKSQSSASEDLITSYQGDNAPDSTTLAQSVTINGVCPVPNPRRVSVALKAQTAQGAGRLPITGVHRYPIPCLVDNPTFAARIALVMMDVEFIGGGSQRRGGLAYRVRA